MYSHFYNFINAPSELTLNHLRDGKAVEKNEGPNNFLAAPKMVSFLLLAADKKTPF